MNIQNYVDFARKALGVKFRDINLLIQALTHRSYINEHRRTANYHNERLEFLGDAVLELIVTEHLYHNYEEPEGILTNWRSALVRTESISQAGLELDLEPLLRLSRGEKHGSERARQQILANAFEASLGAVYLDQGIEAARRIIRKYILVKLEGVIKTGTWIDPKSSLQEKVQSQENLTPIYRVISETGPDHNKIFQVGVYVGKQLRGQGEGPSKQLAQQVAAEEALNRMMIDTPGDNL